MADLGTLIFRRPAIFAYTLVFKMQSRISKLGIEINHPFLYFISGKFLNHALIIFLGGILIAANIQSSKAENSFIPQNILSHFISENEEAQEYEEGASPASQSSYAQVPAVGIDDQTHEEAPPQTPGDVALNSGALLKPTLPTTSERIVTPNALKYYAVQDGDTLAVIARRSGIKISTLLWANTITATQTLRIGQRLLVPPIDGIIYHVKRGDTISKIAQLYGADSGKILAFNNIAGDRLAMGATLIIPDGIQPTIALAEKKGIGSRLKQIFVPEEPIREPRSIPASIRSAGGMVWPTTAHRISQYFSWHHTGVDIAGPTSNTIEAAAGGVVEIAGWQRGYGNTILLSHPDGKKTRYGHASRLYVHVGDTVKQGEVIAQVGSTGRSTGPHVHFEVLIAGKRVNPLLFIR